MDLKEITENNSRHPWETARAHTVVRIFKRYISLGQSSSILDVGCGDGYASRVIAEAVNPKMICALDVHLTEQQIKTLQTNAPSVYFEKYPNKIKQKFNCLVFMDVLEHIEQDVLFLKEHLDRFASGKGMVLITVPAFPALFGSHDVFLGHYRRHTRKTIHDLMTACGLNVVQSGYIFTSLVPFRWLSVQLEKLAFSKRQPQGVGAWKGSPVFTKLIYRFMMLDNAVSLWLAQKGIYLPGLSVWAVGRKG